MKVVVRQVNLSDHNFIYATYLRNRWFNKDNTTTLKRSTWSALQHKRLEDILNNHRIRVACLDEDLDTILGYYIPIEKFTYVKLAWRKHNPNIQTLLEDSLK